MRTRHRHYCPSCKAAVRNQGDLCGPCSVDLPLTNGTWVLGRDRVQRWVPDGEAS